MEFFFINQQFLFSKVRIGITSIFFISLLLCSCSGKSDEEYVAEERDQLKEFLQADQILYYKGIKTFVRFAIAENQKRPILYKSEFDKLEAGHLTKVASSLVGYSSGADSTALVVNPMEYYKAYTEYSKIKDLLKKVDEDSLPTFCELFSANGKIIDSLFAGFDIRSIEHLLFGVSIYTPQKLPQSLVLYELSKVKMESLGQTDVRSVAQSINGLVLSQYKFPYLSELEHTQNLTMLESGKFIRTILNPSIAPPPQVRIDPEEYVRLELHSVSLLGRALARISMDREDKKKLAIKDMELFLKNAETIGWDNELVWLTGAYVGLYNEDKEQALKNLKKLEKSTLVSEDLRVVISETIQYLENRESDKALNALNDKAFMAKLSFNLVVYGIKKSGVMDDLNSKGSDKLLNLTKRLEAQSDNLNQFLKLDKVGEKKEELLNKTKDLF